MMECDEARDLLDAYADNALELAEAARLNRHLQGCAACRAGGRSWWTAATPRARRDAATGR